MKMLMPFVALSVATVDCDLSPNLVLDFLREKHLKIGIVFTCAPKQQTIALIKAAQQQSVFFGGVDIHRGIDGVDLERLFRFVNNPIAVFVDLDCNCCAELLREVSKRTFFHQRYHWLMFTSNKLDASHRLANENINFDAEITLAVPLVSSTDDAHQLYEVFNHSHDRGGQLNVTATYVWSRGMGSHPVAAQTKRQRRMNFNGLTLKTVVTAVDVPYHRSLQHHLESLDFPHRDSMNRFNYRLFKMMEEIHNFKMYILRTHAWGIKSANGTWNGAIGFMARQEVDLCITPLRWSPERYGVYDATTNTYRVKVMFIFLHPKSSIEASNIFLVPFETTVWVCTVIVGLTMAVVLRKIFVVENHRLVRRFVRNATDNDEQRHGSSWSNSLLIIFGILFQQGFSSVPALTSARLIALSTLVFSILLFQFYSSFIVASLLIESPKTIRTMQQLLDSQLECALDEISYMRDIFNHATDPVALELYQRKIVRKDNFYGRDKGMELIKRGGFAYHTDASSFYFRFKNFLTDNEICDLQEIAFTKPFECAPGVPLMSPFLDMIKINFRRMYETGLHSYHSAIWESRKPECAKTDLDVAPVDLEHFSSALYILLIGMSLSGVLMCTEVLVHRAMRRQEKTGRFL